MTETIKQDVIVGVDLGGTKILAGIFTPQLKQLHRQAEHQGLAGF